MSTEEPRTPAQRIARAREILATGEALDAFRELRSVLSYSSAPDDALLRDGLDALAAIAQVISGDELAKTIGAARDRVDDPQALFDAAYALYENDLHDIAATLLRRADALAPGEPGIVMELVANLEAIFLHREAARVLAKSPVTETHALCGYLHGYNSLMSGDLETARAVSERLAGEEDAEVAPMRAALAAMIARADGIRGAARLDSLDLAGWHLVVNGGVLLHLSPHGYEDAMRGRYAYVSDGYELLREGIDRLGAALAAAGIAAPRVLALPRPIEPDFGARGG